MGLLLGPEARLRLVPALNYTGTVPAAVLYRAWDQTSGSEGSKVDTTDSGGSSALSSDIDWIPITVSSEANQAPVLASPAQVFLTSIQEGDVNSTGDRVRDLLGALVTDADGNVCGMAVYGQDTNRGVWEYYSTKGTAWVPLGAVSPTAARLLAPETYVRFVPAGSYSGTVSNGLSFRAWDRSAGVNAGTASLVSNGGSTPYSSGTGQAGITVTLVNHAPGLSSASGLAFTPILENDLSNSGNTVSNLLNRLVTDADGDTCGIAVLEINTENGLWQYWSTQGRGRWVTLVQPLALSALLLGPDVRVRFVPDVDYHGTITNGLFLRAWDQTKGTNGGLVMVLETGGQTAYRRTARWVSLEVTEANRAPTDIVLDNTLVRENQPVGTVVGHLSATDPNDSDSHTFTLVPGEGDDDNAAFTISSKTNVLKTAAAFDRETRAEYSIRVRARDSGTLEQVFVITIGDLRDTAPSDILLHPAVVAENEPAGTVVGQLTAVDPDLGKTHTFALVAGEGDADNSAFVIQDRTLKTTASFDFETQQFFQVRIQANDGYGGTFAKTLLIAVGDVADNAPPSDLTLNSTCLFDGTPADTAVALLRVIDLNPEDTHTFSLVSGTGDTDNAAFQVAGSTLLTAATINFTAHPRYAIRLQADDGHGGTFQKAFEIVPAEPLWRDDFEHGPGEWTHAAEQGLDTWQLVEGPHRSATHALSASGTPNLSDASAASPWIKIPTNAQQLRLEFHQRYDWGALLSDPLDGGVLELRRQGEPWGDVVGSDINNSFIAGRYAVEMPTTPGHPLSERPVWTGIATNQFGAVSLALGASQLKGRTVQFRWRQAMGSGITERQWQLDDVALGVVVPPDPSGFRIERCILVGKQLELTWASIPGLAYVNDATPTLGTPWTTVTGILSGQTNATRTSVLLDLPTLPGYSQNTLYFRVQKP